MKPYYDNGQSVLYHGDCRSMTEIPDESIQCVVTSPPYWGLRDYGVDGQIGLEETPEAYVETIRDVFREVWRVLKKDGTLWLNLGDSYSSGGRITQVAPTLRRKGHDAASGKQENLNGLAVRPGKCGIGPKQLRGIPWHVAFALQADGWYLRQDLIWAKPNPMPESVTDRCTKAHEYLFLLAKRARYYYDHEAIKEPSSSTGAMKTPDGWDTGAGSHGSFHREGREKGQYRIDKQRGYGRRHAGFNDRWNLISKEEQSANGRNKRSVWTVATQPYKEAHFATFPEALVEPCILAGSRPGDTVLDPFAGSGTTLWVAQRLGRKAIGYELKREYCDLALERIKQIGMAL